MYTPKLRSIIYALVVVFVAGCSGQSCSCVEPIKGGFPVGERHASAIQIRATDELFNYFSQQGPTIIPKLLPMGPMFNVPPSCGSNKVCCATPAPMCRLSFDFKTLSLAPTPAAMPAEVKMSTDLVLKTLDNLPVEFTGIKCVISIDTTRSGGQTMNISSDIQFPVNATTANTELKLVNTAVSGIDNGDLNVNEPGSDFLCLGLSLLKGFVISTLQDQVATQIEDTVSKQTCMACMDKSWCNSFASDCKNGVCVLSDGMTCVQEVGMDGRMDVGKSLASFSPGLQAKMDVLAVLGAYAKSDTGLSLGMLGGGVADPHNPCVPILPKPQPVMVKPSTTFTTDVLPDSATPYHLGIGVHVSHFDTLGFAAFDSGALCLKVGTPSVALLSAKTISVVIPSLGDLTHGGDAPMFLVMRPQKPPTFTMGKGTFKLDANNKKVIDDPLLKIAVPDFNIDFYAFVDEHYVRLMTLTSDLLIPVSLDVDMNNQVVPLLGDFTSAFTRVTVTNTELLSESPNDLAKTFPMLLGLAGGQLGGVLKPIALPAIMGLNIKPVAITSTDPDPSGTNQFLSIFANLSTAAALHLAADTSVRLERVVTPPTVGFAVNTRTAVVPTVTLALSGQSVGDRALEYSHNVDASGWSPFTEATSIDVTHPVLWAQGRHTIQVRARAVGLPETLDPTPAEIEVIIDTVPPEGSFDRSTITGELTFTATDRVSPKETLKYRWRGGAGPYSDWSPLDHVRFSRYVDLNAVEVQVRDEVGNVGTLDFHGRTTAPASGGCGCDVGGAPTSPGTTAGGLALIGLCVILLRRRALVLLVLLAGCNSSLGKGDFVSNVDSVGRYHDVAAFHGTFHVSAYDESVGDLVYARIHELGKPISWQYVDGIDASASVDMPGGYRKGVSDAGPDVGFYTSIGLTRGGDPRIAYYDVTNGALKYAAGPGQFRVHTVQAGDGGVKAGMYAALSLDDKDVPTIAFMVTGTGDGTNGFKSELRVAVARNDNPTAPGDWTITTVDTTRISCQGRCGASAACIQTAMVNMMPNGDPAISTCVPKDAAACPTMCADTEVCIKATCTTFLPTVKAIELPDGVGLFTQARRAANGVLQLVYYDRAQGDLKLAAGKGDGTYTVSIIDGNDANTDVGQFASARIATDGVLHVAYVDAVNDRLLYKTVNAGTPMDMPEVIDDGMRDDGPHPIGSGAALVLDGTTPRVVYQEQQRSDLLQARRAASWTRSDLSTGVAGFGWWPHLISEGGKIYLSQFIYDRQNGSNPFGTFQLNALP